MMSPCLGDEAEVCAGQPVGPNMLKEPPEQHGICYIKGLYLTRTTSKHATNMAMDVQAITSLSYIKCTVVTVYICYMWGCHYRSA